MSDIYREHILDHYANPRNQGHLDAPQIFSDADDPACGDQVRIEIELDAQGNVARVAFEGQGCIVSMASASIFTEYLKGRHLTELEAISDEDLLTLLDAPIGESRLRCALLPLQVLRAGLAAYRSGGE